MFCTWDSILNIAFLKANLYQTFFLGKNSSWNWFQLNDKEIHDGCNKRAIHLEMVSLGLHKIYFIIRIHNCYNFKLEFQDCDI